MQLRVSSKVFLVKLSSLFGLLFLLKSAMGKLGHRRQHGFYKVMTTKITITSMRNPEGVSTPP